MGSEVDDDIRARQGDDFVSGFGGADSIEGGTGADRMNGNSGPDLIHASAAGAKVNSDGVVSNLFYVDNSDDIIRDGAQNDRLYGGFGQGGHDQVFGDGGSDFIVVSQRYFRALGDETKITRETVDCGPGEDTVYFDRGIDQIDRKNCEIPYPVDPDGAAPGQPVARSVAALKSPF